MTVVPTALRTLLLILLGEGPASPTLPGAGYRVGPGDVLEVTVAGRPDLARLPTVQTTGLIWISHSTEGVKVEGLTALEIGTALTELLARQGPARPEVTVTVKEFRSQFVFLAGEVNQPGRKPLKGRLRLLDALLEAGGFTARASGEVLVQRQEGTFEDGGAVRRFRFPRTGPTPGGLAELETVLRSGDVVTASLGRYVTLAGEVVHPGRYTLEGETTLSAIVSSAGGFTRLASRRVKVSRRDPTSGHVQVLQPDLEAIEKGREPDFVLLPDDRIEVKARLL